MKITRKKLIKIAKQLFALTWFSGAFACIMDAFRSLAQDSEIGTALLIFIAAIMCVLGVICLKIK